MREVAKQILGSLLIDVSRLRRASQTRGENRRRGHCFETHSSLPQKCLKNSWKQKTLK
jgi:hypothetical protein